MYFLLVILTVLLTVYGQFIIKWQLSGVENLSGNLPQKILVILGYFLNPWILSAFFAAFVAALCWMAAMTKLPLSHAYPFVGLTFVFVLIGSGIFFNESITPLKILGTALIVIGIVVASQG